jgi:acylaminoacyl-peptidase
MLTLSALTILLVRGSLGFGEEALQSLPGNIGSQVLLICSCAQDNSPWMSKIIINSLMILCLLNHEQDVNDVLTALEFVIKKGLIDASRVAVVGGSHGGFLTTHLIGQVF